MTEPYFITTNDTNLTFLYENYTSSIHDVERLVSISVFILFSFIFLAGLVGNGLVVMGKQFNLVSRINHFFLHLFLWFFWSCCRQSDDAIDDKHFNYQLGYSRFIVRDIL